MNTDIYQITIGMANGLLKPHGLRIMVESNGLPLPHGRNVLKVERIENIKNAKPPKKSTVKKRVPVAKKPKRKSTYDSSISLKTQKLLASIK